jgi:hypothetical protein
MKNIFTCIIILLGIVILLSIRVLRSCTPQAQPAGLSVKHADPFYDYTETDYPWLHLPLIKPIEVNRQDGRSPWKVFSLPDGPLIRIANSQGISYYNYSIEELEKFAVSNGVIMAYSAYVDKEADASIRDNYYHWFVLIPEKKIGEGFHTEDEFRQYIQTLGIQEPDWQIPDEAYAQFERTGCLAWFPDCK